MAAEADLRKHNAGISLRSRILPGLVGPAVLVLLTAAALATPPERASRPAYLGVHLDEETPGRLLVADVEPDSPAAHAGLQPGDILCKMDGQEVPQRATVRALLRSRSPGDAVSLQVLRSNRSVELTATLAATSRPLLGSSPAREAVEAVPLQGWDIRRRPFWSREVFRLAVVPIDFPDVPGNPQIGRQDWEEALFSQNRYLGRSATGQPVYGSLNDYYQEQSSGAFRLEGRVFDPVTAGRKRAEYAAAADRTVLLTEALDRLLAREGEDFLKGFDGLLFLYAGGRCPSARCGELYWPHRAALAHRGRQWPYIICPEGGPRMTSISVLAHEFGHLLGLPDLYAPPDRPDVEGLGVWCTMSAGQGRDGKPLHLCAWCKEQLGWLKPTVIDPAVKQDLILAPIEGAPRECFKILLQADGSEYFLLENRAARGFDRDLPGEGLLIWRVVDGRPILEESHGLAGPPGPERFLGAVPYPSRANNAFTPETTPSSRSLKGGGPSVHLTNIRRLPDGRIAFRSGYEYL